jgi:hypothetical protein
MIKYVVAHFGGGKCPNWVTNGNEHFNLIPFKCRCIIKKSDCIQTTYIPYINERCAPKHIEAMRIIIGLIINGQSEILFHLNNHIACLLSVCS